MGYLTETARCKLRKACLKKMAWASLRCEEFLVPHFYGVLCAGGGRSLELAVCARRAALWSVMPYGRALRRREAPSLWRAPLVRRTSCGLQRQASAACHAAHARRHSLSLERRRTTRACCARAPYHAGCGRLMPCERALHWREASFLRPTPVVRRASCGLQRQASAACLAQRWRAVLAVPGEEAKHSSFQRARAMPRWLWSNHTP